MFKVTMQSFGQFPQCGVNFGNEAGALARAVELAQDILIVRWPRAQTRLANLSIQRGEYKGVLWEVRASHDNVVHGQLFRVEIVN